MAKDAYERVADSVPFEDSLPNPWLDDPTPVSKQYPDIQFRLKEFHNSSRLMHAKGQTWPYRLPFFDEAMIMFFEFRGYGPPPDDVGHPGDVYIDLTRSIGSPYLLYVHGVDQWDCVDWSSDPDQSSFPVPKHPLLKDRFLSGTKEKQFSWVTQETLYKRHVISHWMDMKSMLQRTIHHDRVGALRVTVTEDARQRERVEKRRRKRQWNARLEPNRPSSTKGSYQALAGQSIQEPVHQKQEGHHPEVDDAMPYNKSMHSSPRLSITESPGVMPEIQRTDEVFSGPSTQKRKRSTTPSCRDFSSKRKKCSDSTHSVSEPTFDFELFESLMLESDEKVDKEAEEDKEDQEEIWKEAEQEQEQEMEHVSVGAAQNAMDVVARYITQQQSLKGRVDELSAALKEERENTAQLRMIIAEQDTKLSEATHTISQQREGEAKALQAMTAERDQAVSEKLNSDALHAAKISEAEDLFLKGQQFLASLKSGTI